MLDPEKPGNYYLVVIEPLVIIMYVVAPLTTIIGFIMLMDGYQSVQEFDATKRGKIFQLLYRACAKSIVVFCL